MPIIIQKGDPEEEEARLAAERRRKQRKGLSLLDEYSSSEDDNDEFGLHSQVSPRPSSGDYCGSEEAKVSGNAKQQGAAAMKKPLPSPYVVPLSDLQDLMTLKVYAVSTPGPWDKTEPVTKLVGNNQFIGVSDDPPVDEDFMASLIAQERARQAAEISTGADGRTEPTTLQRLRHMHQQHGAHKEAPKAERISELIKPSEMRRFWIENGHNLDLKPLAADGSQMLSHSFEETLRWALEVTDMKASSLLPDLLALPDSLSAFQEKVKITKKYWSVRNMALDGTAAPEPSIVDLAKFHMNEFQKILRDEGKIGSGSGAMSSLGSVSSRLSLNSTNSSKGGFRRKHGKSPVRNKDSEKDHHSLQTRLNQIQQGNTNSFIMAIEPPQMPRSSRSYSPGKTGRRSSVLRKTSTVGVGFGRLRNPSVSRMGALHEDVASSPLSSPERVEMGSVTHKLRIDTKNLSPQSASKPAAAANSSPDCSVTRGRVPHHQKKSSSRTPSTSPVRSAQMHSGSPQSPSTSISPTPATVVNFSDLEAAVEDIKKSSDMSDVDYAAHHAGKPADTTATVEVESQNSPRSPRMVKSAPDSQNTLLPRRPPVPRQPHAQSTVVNTGPMKYSNAIQKDSEGANSAAKAAMKAVEKHEAAMKKGLLHLLEPHQNRVNKLEKSALSGVYKSSRVKRTTARVTNKLVDFDSFVNDSHKKTRQLCSDREFNFAENVGSKMNAFSETPLGRNAVNEIDAVEKRAKMMKYWITSYRTTQAEWFVKFLSVLRDMAKKATMYGEPIPHCGVRLLSIMHLFIMADVALDKEKFYAFLEAVVVDHSEHVKPMLHKIIRSIREYVGISAEKFSSYLEKANINPCPELMSEVRALRKKRAKQAKMRAEAAKQRQRTSSFGTYSLGQMGSVGELSVTTSFTLENFSTTTNDAALNTGVASLSVYDDVSEYGDADEPN